MRFLLYRLRLQIPELQRSVELLKHLKSKQVGHTFLSMLFVTFVLIGTAQGQCMHVVSMPMMWKLFIYVYAHIVMHFCPTLNTTHSSLFQDSTDVVETQFLLSDQVYAMAKVPPSKTVCLWLGVGDTVL